MRDQDAGEWWLDCAFGFIIMFQLTFGLLLQIHAFVRSLQ